MVALVANEDDGGVAAEASDDLQPVFDLVLGFALAAIDDEEVEAALAEEELMGGVHNFLPAKVPEVELYGLLVNFHVPALDRDALGFSLVGVEALTKELTQEGGFANVAFADEEDFGFVEGAVRLGLELEVVVKDGGRIAEVAPISSQNFWRDR